MSTRTRPMGPGAPLGGVDRFRDRIWDDRMHDPYRHDEKYPEPTVCAVCGALFADGRWQWGDGPKSANRVTCPACLRVVRDDPAGELTLAGEFFVAHRDDLLRIVRAEAEREKREHPLNRIVKIDEHPGRAVVTTTDLHLPHRIARALEAAYEGRISLRYAKDAYRVTARWER